MPHHRRPLPSTVADHPVEGRNLGVEATTLGSLLDARGGPTVLVFLRHHG
ncbi:MAG: hypothetical protein AAGA93_09630 [Actinomycetota bacterium]